MSDLIDRQAAIDILHGYFDGMLETDTWSPCDVYGLIKLLPSVQPEPQWIPCSERMPEPRVDVWCHSDMGEMVGYYEEYIDAWYGRDYLELIVTAWMPLPEPYKEGGEQE